MRFATIYIIWLREIKKYIRNKSRIVGALGMPFFFMLVLGGGFGGRFDVGGVNYREFLMPGIVGMVLLFSSVFSGISVIWDRQFGFLKEMLVAPISRTSIIFGRTLGGMTTSIMQAIIMLVLSILLGVKLGGITGFLSSLFFMALISASFVAVGIAFASRMTDMQGFQLIMNFLIMPIFFLSGAVYPLDGLPNWLSVLTYLDPLTYGIDALRHTLIGLGQIPLWIDTAVLIGFCVVAISVGTYMFRKATI